MNQVRRHRRWPFSITVATALATVLPVAVTSPAFAQAVVSAQGPATRADSMSILFRRAQRLVNDGAGAEGRALVDSVLESTEPRSPEEAEALYWRATLAESWERAQRDYLRIMLEHERSPRVGDAMLRLAQGEVARGDRDAAQRYLERLAREAPASAARAEGGLWHGRLLLERGMQSEGCGVLRGTRGLVAPGAIELENQFDYLLNQCPSEVAATAAAAPTSQAAPTPTPAPTPVTPPAPTTASAAPAGWSVQVAAFSSREEASALVTRLAERGYEARVDGSAAPFRVRFGRYPTRAAAAAAMEAYRAKERADAFLVQVPRG
jgi:cell division septation protein DedD